MKFLTLVSVLALCAGCRAWTDDPRKVAEAALTAWRDSEPAVLSRLAHQELKQKLRTARLLTFHLERQAFSPDVRALPENRVVELFCDAHRTIVPRDSRVEYFDTYIATEVRGEYAMVVFDSGWRFKNSGQSHQMRNEIVLKKSGDEWLFLWSPAVNLHVDLDWDPRTSLPNPPPPPSEKKP
jgi:hypothetical protein